MIRIVFQRPGLGLAGLVLAGVVAAATPVLEVTMAAEREQVQTRNGRVTVQLLPADHVVPGDSLIYTLQVRNTGSVAVPLPQFTAPIPRHMSYIADSAVAPGADVLFSVDAGLNFDKPQNLRVAGQGGALRAATPADYTHIRWILRHSLKANSVVYARFRARLN
ncbi:MAG: hypothetical protein ACHQIL_09015 [Steroidobacterales bacterium]